MKRIVTGVFWIVLLAGIAFGILNAMSVSCGELALDRKNQISQKNESVGGKVSNFNFAIKSLTNSLATKLHSCP